MASLTQSSTGYVSAELKIDNDGGANLCDQYTCKTQDAEPYQWPDFMMGMKRDKDGRYPYFDAKLGKLYDTTECKRKRPRIKYIDSLHEISRILKRKIEEHKLNIIIEVDEHDDSILDCSYSIPDKGEYEFELKYSLIYSEFPEIICKVPHPNIDPKTGKFSEELTECIAKMWDDDIHSLRDHLLKTLKQVMNWLKNPIWDNYIENEWILKWNQKYKQHGIAKNKIEIVTLLFSVCNDSKFCLMNNTQENTKTELAKGMLVQDESSLKD